MKSTSLKGGRTAKLYVASIFLVSGCASGPLGLGQGAGIKTGADLNLVVDSVAEMVDLSTLPSPATRTALPLSPEAAGSGQSTLAIGIQGDSTYSDPARPRTVQTLGLSVLQSLDLQAMASLHAKGNANGQADVEALTTASESADASASASTDASASASTAASASGSITAGNANARANGNANLNANAYGQVKIDGWVFQRIDFKPTRIEVHLADQASGSADAWISLPVPDGAPLDLVALNEAATASFLAAAQLTAGSYDQIRFWGADTHRRVESDANSYLAIDENGTAHTGVYKLPGQVLTLNSDFEVKADSATELKLSFNPRAALHRAGNRLILEPTALRVETHTTANASAQ